MKQLLVFLTLFAFSGSVSAQETKKTTQKSRKEQKREKINAQIKAEEEGVIAYWFLMGMESHLKKAIPNL